MTANADVSSANTVGFQKISVEAGKWYMLAPQFEDVANAGGATIDLLKTMTFDGFKAVSYANRLNGSKISIYEGGAYTTYYYVNGTGGVGWRKTPAAPTTLPVNVGSGVWLWVQDTEGEASITTSGQVKDANTFSVNVGNDGEWKIVSNPYPTDLTIGNLATTDLTAVTYANRLNGSQISVYNAGAYTTFYYVNGSGGTQWRTSPPMPAASTVICPIGKGFWVKAASAGTLTFSLNK